jgi:hypothetical protein
MSASRGSVSISGKGYILIEHCGSKVGGGTNLRTAHTIKERILSKFPHFEVEIKKDLLAT